ncbi:MAG: InlB B-repeat-containing protein, partial [Planctomycetota bacterium]
MKRQILLGVLILFAVGGFATAATLNVPTIPYPTIQAAIDDANDGDEVVVANGVWKGVGNRDLDFGNGLPFGQTRAITVRSTNPNDPNIVADTIIDCNGLGRAFIFDNYEDNNSVVEGFTIRNGSAVFGGAIECYSFANPKIANCIIRGNSAYDGGGIDCYYSSPLIVDCVITGNTASNDGGGVECWEAAPEIINCLIQGNTAGGYGGAIDCYLSDPNITNCTIAYNSGVSGDSGGVYAEFSSPTITNCIIWGNGDDLAGCIAKYSCIEDGDAGTGNISDNPLFKTGPLGGYYLSNYWAGQILDPNGQAVDPNVNPEDANSPCIDAGDPGVTSYVDDANYTTRTDSEPDSNIIVDMGYHYPDSGPAVYYQLVTDVDVNDPNVIGFIDPNLPDAGDPNGSFIQFAEVLLTAIPNDVDCFKVNKWTIDGNDLLYEGETLIVTMDSNKTVTVEFEHRKEYFLDTYVVGVGGTTRLFDSNEPNGWYCDGVDVNVIAEPALGYAVFEWTVDGSPVPLPAEPNVLTVTMDANKTVTVEFTTVFVHLDFEIIGGKGTIRPARGGNYPVGTVVNLEATPDLGSRVKEWGGDADGVPFLDPNDPNNNTVTMTEDKSVTVEFEQIPTYELTTSVADGNGTVAPTAPPPVDYNPVSGIYTYYIGATVTITASPDIGWHVEDWNGTDDDSSKATTNSVVMNSNRDVTVAFAPGFPIGEIWVYNSSGIPYLGPYSAIQDAIDDAFGGFPGFEGDPEATPLPLPPLPAIPGDLIIVADGNYTGPKNRNLDF